MKHTPESWSVGWGSGLTGPTCAVADYPFCGGQYWPYIPVHKGQETIALVPAPDKDTMHIPDKEMMEANANLIALSPTMYKYIQQKAKEGDQKAIEIIKTLK
jgi:hypothetical protein